jgi:tRNA/tmRNA/rRNA uracil-C5-methylase (TrmA/RlmC/RlmD family)
MITSPIITLREGCVKACRACRHRQWTAAESLMQKMAFLRSALAPWAEQLLEIIALQDEEQRWGYREKVKLSARCYDGRWEFGMEPLGDLIPLPRCPVQLPLNWNPK